MNGGVVLRIVATALAVLVGAGVATLGLAGARWRAGTAASLEHLNLTVPAGSPLRFSGSDLAALPAPVARYFRAVLQDGRPLIRSGHFQQTGQFFTGGKWAPFTADHYFVTDPVGFVWDARIRMAPGMSVRVRDGLVLGQGSMLAKVLGLVTVARSENNEAITAGALHRYLAEAVWYPTALLPAAGVVWSAIDDSSARATLTAAGTTVSLDFHFGPDSLVRRIFTPNRQHQEGDSSVARPWQVRLMEYEYRDDVRIPIMAEVEWLLPEGVQTYWKGRTVSTGFDD